MATHSRRQEQSHHTAVHTASKPIRPKHQQVPQQQSQDCVPAAVDGNAQRGTKEATTRQPTQPLIQSGQSTRRCLNSHRIACEQRGNSNIRWERKAGTGTEEATTRQPTQPLIQSGQSTSGCLNSHRIACQQQWMATHSRDRNRGRHHTAAHAASGPTGQSSKPTYIMLASSTSNKHRTRS
jgi:hypothetical protein